MDLNKLRSEVLDKSVPKIEDPRFKTLIQGEATKKYNDFKFATPEEKQRIIDEINARIEDGDDKITLKSYEILLHLRAVRDGGSVE